MKYKVTKEGLGVPIGTELKPNNYELPGFITIIGGNYYHFSDLNISLALQLGILEEVKEGYDHITYRNRKGRTVIVESSKFDINDHEGMDTPKEIEELEFDECDYCRSKPGSPQLCKDCLWRRMFVNKHNEIIETLNFLTHEANKK